MTNRTSRRVFLLGSYAPSLLNFRGPLIAAIAARGHEVIAAAPEIDGDTAAKLRALGATPLSVEMARTGTNPVEDLALMRRLRALFKARKPDVFIGYTAKPVIWGSLAAHSARVPVIAPMITGLGYAFAEGGSWKQKLLQRAVIATYRRALAHAHHIFFQNPDDIATFRSLSLLPPALPVTMVNGSGVDVDHFAPESLPDTPAFLMIARLLKAKGVREYAEAAMAVSETHKDARFSLVGWLDPAPDAIDEADLKRWIAGGLDYQGALDDVRPAIKACSVYVLPSYREGTPRSVLEAMAMGRPIITTDVPGCRETVTDGDNGLLVTVRDAAALADAMRTLADDAGLRAKMGKRSRAIAEDKYDVRKVNAAVMDALGL